MRSVEQAGLAHLFHVATNRLGRDAEQACKLADANMRLEPELEQNLLSPLYLFQSSRFQGFDHGTCSTPIFIMVNKQKSQNLE